MILRYTRPEMAAIWEPESKYGIWLEIETLAAEAMAELGVIPEGGTGSRSRPRAKFEVERVDEIEREVKARRYRLPDQCC